MIRVRVLTFNLLAPCYHRLESDDEARYTARNLRIVELLRHINSDVVCLQELWMAGGLPRLFGEQLLDRYALITFKRTRHKEDAIAFLVSRALEVIDVHNIPFDDDGDRVASVVHLRSGGQDFLVGNTHLTFPHSDFDDRLRRQQVGGLLGALEAYQRLRFGAHYAGVPTVLAGDFNGDCDDYVYRHLAAHGFRSAALDVLGRELAITHKNHRGHDVSVDFVFYSVRARRLRPLAVRVFPEHVDDRDWPDPADYALSDHRPIEAEFALDAAPAAPVRAGSL